MASSSKGSGYYLFGRDIMTIPCFRTCFLTGFTASVGVTLVHFLFYSHGIKAFKWGQVAFIGVSFPYWFICREQEYKKQLALDEVQKSISAKLEEEYIITDSLEFGPETFG